jgi:thioredoxin reductase
MKGSTKFDYLIIGAGPAGLQLGYFLEKANRNYLILEAGDTAGTFFKEFPRHGQLISINKVYTGSENPEVNLRWDWNSLLSDSDQMLFKHYSKRYFPNTHDLVSYLGDFAEHFQLNIQYNSKVVHISKNKTFSVNTNDGNTYESKRLIIATGLTKPYIPPIPGFELVEQYTDVSVDPENFINQKVLILGKGNSAFETADNLIETAAVIHVASPNPIKMAWKTHFPGNLRAVNNNFLDTYQLKSQNAILDATITQIQRRDDGKYVVSVSYTHASGEKEDLIYDRVIACTGWRFDNSIFDESCEPELAINNRFPRQTSEWESTNIKDLYFAGTITQVRDFKKNNSGFIHGFRYNVKALHRILECKYYGGSWLHRVIDSTPETIVDTIINRVNTSSALWQQFGFFCDAIMMDDSNCMRYYEELPVDYLHEDRFSKYENYYTVTLEFGEIDDDPFNIPRHPDVDKAKESTFLHPVIRQYRCGELISEHHVLEDLDGEWLKELHIKPLVEFFEHGLSENANRVGVNSLIRSESTVSVGVNS